MGMDIRSAAYGHIDDNDGKQAFRPVDARPYTARAVCRTFVFPQRGKTGASRPGQHGHSGGIEYIGSFPVQSVQYGLPFVLDFPRHGSTRVLRSFWHDNSFRTSRQNA